MSNQPELTTEYLARLESIRSQYQAGKLSEYEAMTMQITAAIDNYMATKRADDPEADVILCASIVQRIGSVSA
jgi:hypothetical protein